MGWASAMIIWRAGVGNPIDVLRVALNWFSECRRFVGVLVKGIVRLSKRERAIGVLTGKRVAERAWRSLGMVGFAVRWLCKGEHLFACRKWWSIGWARVAIIWRAGMAITRRVGNGD